MYKEYYDNLILALQTENIQTAFDCCEKAQKLIPLHSLSYLLQIVFLLMQKDIDKAQKTYEELKKINPNIDFDITYENQQELTVFILKHFVSIISPFINENYEAELNAMPNENTYTKGVLRYICSNDISNAFRLAKEALHIFQNNISLQYNMSAILMRSEKIEEAWDFYENRERIFQHHKLLIPNIPKYTSLKDGVKLLVYSVAGFGDTVFYARYLKLLKAMNIELFVYPQPALKDLLLSNGYNVIDSINNYQFDYQISFMSLATLFKTSLDTIPFSEKYIEVPNFKIAKGIISQENILKIGIVWKSGAESDRRIQLNEFSEIFKLKNVQFYSFQKEITLDEKEILEQYNIINLSTQLNTFLDTAAYIEEMDMIIGCDTVVTNLSAAMGKKTFVLVPFFCDYRWGITEFYTPWYTSVNVFRQNVSNNWDKPIKILTNKLKELYS